MEWREILRDFSGRRLSVPSDRLAAISGITSRFAEVLGDYHAGLWGSAWEEELLWKVKDLEKLKPRSTQYQGPPWSWAATNNGVDYIIPSTYDKVDHEDFSVLSCQSYTAGDPLETGSVGALQYSTIAQPLDILV